MPLNNLRMDIADQLCMVSYCCLVTCVNLGLVCFRIMDNLEQSVKILTPLVCFCFLFFLSLFQ